AGARYLVVLDDFYRDPDTGAFAAPRRLDRGGWDRLLDHIARMARRTRDEHGLTLVFHPHCDAAIEAEPEIERFLADTDPALVGLCLDTGHHAYCGGDPVAFLRRHHRRIPYLHLKSMDPAVRERVTAESIPFAIAVAQ